MKLSIAIPAKNQAEKTIANLSGKILPYFDGQGIIYDVLLCTDGTSGEEQAKYETLVKDLPGQVRLLPFEDKKGKGHAIKKAILASDADYVLFMDADLATDLSIFEKIKPLLGNVDCMIASRDLKESVYVQKQPFMRRLTHWGCRVVVQNKFHMKGIKDTQCGYKCFRRDIATKFVERSIINGFAMDVELLYCFYLNGASIVELPAIWTDDANSSVGSPLKTSKTFYADLRKIKKNKANYIFAKEGESC